MKIYTFPSESGTELRPLLQQIHNYAKGIQPLVSVLDLRVCAADSSSWQQPQSI